MSETPLSRRDFLRTSALGATGLAAGLGSGASAGEQRVGAGEKAIRWGIVGTGARSRAHIAAIKSVGGMDIVAACDIDEGRRNQGLERIGKKVASYGDYQKLLANPDVSAVLVCTPNLLHKEMVLAALQAGKHVLCEKPMATTLEDCLAMEKAGESSPLVTHYAMQLRYAHRYADLRRVIEAGKIGAPRYLFLAEFRGDWNKGDVWQYRDPKTGKEMNWRYSQAATGGTLNEKCCHYLDILNWMAGGVPTRLYGSGGRSVYPDRETWDHATVAMEYANGVKATLGLCMFGPHRLDLQIIGEEGALHLPTGADYALFQKGRAEEKVPLTPEVGHGERGPARGIETAVLRMYEDFRSCVQADKKPYVDAEKALASCKAAFLGEHAAAQHKEVAWDALG